MSVLTTGYSGTPLPKKLGIKPGHRVLLDGAPAEFELPLDEDVTVHRQRRPGSYDLALLFCPSRKRLADRWPLLHKAVTPAGRLWVAWPKKASGVVSDLDDCVVREYGLAHGRVDIKVCAIDATWSGQAFVVRLKDR